MSNKNSQEAVIDFLRDEFRRERENDFALLRRIPSTLPRKFLDYFFALNLEEQDALSEAFVQRALFLFFRSVPNPYHSGNIAYKKFVDTLPLMSDWKYEGIRMLKMALTTAKLEPDGNLANTMTDEIKEWIASIKPAKSPEIRKVVKLAVSQLFAPLTITNRGGGLWRYQGIFQNKEISMDINYGGRTKQLRYEISIRDKSRAIALERLGYEQLMGFPFADWDCLEQSNLDSSIALLKDFIIYCAGIPNRLPAEYKQGEEN